MNNLEKVILLAAFIFFFLFITFLFAQKSVSTAVSDLPVELTQQERAWLKDHPEIVLGYTDAFEPEVIVNPDGSLRGIQVDFLAELNRRLGTRIGLKIYPIPELLEKAQNREVDGIMSLHPEFADKLGLLKSRTDFVNYPAVFSRKDVSFNNPSDLVGKRVAVIDKVFFSEQIIERHGKGATILKVQDAEEGLQLIDNGQADYFLGATLNAFLIAKYQLFNLSTQYVFYNYPFHGVIGTRSDWPEFYSILDKGLSSFSREEFEAIVAKWIHLPQLPISLQFSDEENAWLAQNYTVRVWVVDHPPLVILDEGQPRGISIDYLEYIARYTGINFQYFEEIRPFDQAYQSMKNLQGPDLIQSSQVKAEQMAEDLFSNVYFSVLYVIYMRNNADFISGLEGLAGKKIAISGDSLLYKQLLAQVSDSQLVQFDSDYEALIAVSTGQAEAYIGNLTEASYYIQEFNISNLKIAAPSLLKDEVFSFGIRPDWPELATIINKVLDNMSSESRTAIRNKYVAIRFDHGIDISEVRMWGFIGLAVALSIIILVLFWNRSLQKLVAIRTTTLTESEKRFRATFEQAAVGIAHVSPEGHFLRINQRFCDIVGYNQGEILELTFQDITHPDDLDADVAEVQCLLNGESETYSMEKRYIRKDTHHVWMNLTVSLVRDETGAPSWFVAVVNDISKRKRAEMALQESEERFRSLMEQSPLSIQICDKEGRVVDVNKAWMKLWNITEEDLPAVKENYNILHDEEAAKRGIIPFIERAFKGENILLPEIEYESAGAIETIGLSDEKTKTIWLRARFYPVKDEEGNIKNVISIEEDISERKQADEKLKERDNELKESEAILSALLENSLDLIAYRDMKGCLVMFNQAFTKLVWDVFAIKAVPGLRTMDTQGEAFKDHWEGILKKVIEGERYHDEFSWESKTGEMQHFEIAIRRIVKDGKVIGTAEFTRNITERKQAELELAKFDEALKESEEKFRSLVEQSPISIQIHTPDGRLLQSNAAYARLYALNEQILEELYEKYNVLEDKQARNLGIMPYIEKVFAGEDAVFPDYMYDGVDTLKTLDFKNPVSRKVWIQTRGYPIKNKDGKIVNAAFMSEDITDRKIAEELLKESEEKFRHLVEQSPFSIQIFNPDGYLDQVNTAFMNLWGITEETLPELSGKYNVLEDKEARKLGISKAIRRAFKGDFVTLPLIEYDADSTFTDIGMSREGGNKRWILPRLYPLKNAQGEVVQVVVMEEDITERKYAEEKYRVLVEQAQDGIIIIRDGKIIFVNPYLAKQQGYTESEILNTPFTDYIFPDEIEKVREIYQLRMAGKPAPMVYESALKSKDGSRLEVEFNAAVIIYEGKPADLVIVRDISDRKQVEKEFQQYHGRLKSLAAQLTLAEEKERRRIATDLHDQIGQLLASSRFQLAAMINKIDDPVLSEKLQNVSGNLRLAVEDTRHIISDLSSPLLNELGFEAAISEWLEENVQNRFDIKTSLSCNTRQIDLEEDVGIMLYRSVRELLTNVIKHARATKVEVVIESDKEILKLMVRDNGIGFNYDPQQLILKGESSLGLFSIRERMFDLGGEMEVNTAKLKGTEITLIVPLSKKRKSSK